MLLGLSDPGICDLEYNFSYKLYNCFSAYPMKPAVLFERSYFHGVLSSTHLSEQLLLAMISKLFPFYGG